MTVEYNLLPQDKGKTEGTATIQPGNSAAIARVAIKASKDRLPDFFSEDSWTRLQHYEDITGTDVAVWTYEF